MPGDKHGITITKKPIFLADQVKGFETEWSRDAVENYAFLRINGLKDPNGNIYEFTDLQEFAKTHNLNIKTLQIQRKKRSTNFCGGWSILRVIDLRD